MSPTIISQMLIVIANIFNASESECVTRARDGSKINQPLTSTVRDQGGILVGREWSVLCPLGGSQRRVFLREKPEDSEVCVISTGGHEKDAHSQRENGIYSLLQVTCQSSELLENCQYGRGSQTVCRSPQVHVQCHICLDKKKYTFQFRWENIKVIWKTQYTSQTLGTAVKKTSKRLLQ